MSARAPRPLALPPSRWAAPIFAAAVVLSSFTLLFTILHDILQAREPPALAPEPPARPALASHVLFVVLDGLRHDYATDPARAPAIARHMRDDAHAEVWAGRVTMTSAAILTFGSGLRGDFAQIVGNLNVRRAKSNDLLANARAAGLRTALVGDEGWVQAFGDFSQQVTDEQGLSIDMDDSEQMLSAARAMAVTPPRPDLLVVHIIALDHQGHAFGSASDRYADSLRRFDERFESFLAALPEKTTVMVLSDHGMTDTGAHGADTPRERRTPLFAYGPGVRPGAAIGRAEQVDVAPTLAALLGVAAPTHGRGAAMVELLDVDPAAAAEIECADARRVQRLVRAEADPSLPAVPAAEACARRAAQPAERVAAARASVRAYDAALDEAGRSAGALGGAASALITLGLLLLGALLVVPRLAPRPPLFAAAFGFAPFAVSALSVFLTYRVERITPPFHNVTRGVLFALSNGALLGMALRPALGARFFERWPALALALLPGALAFSYPANTQPECLVTLLLVGAIWIFAPHADLARPRWLSLRRPALPWSAVLLFAGALGALVPFAIRQDEPDLRVLSDHPRLQLLVAMISVVVWLVSGAARRDDRPRARDVGAASALACLALFLRREVPWQVGLTALFVFPLLALFAATVRRNTLACGLAFGAYAWVSRDFEVLAVVGAAMALESIGLAAAPAAGDARSERGRPFALATLAAALFAGLFLCRVGLQRGLDFSNIDWGAGVFRDPRPSQWRVGLSIGWKYVAAELLLAFLFLRPLGAPLRRGVTWVFTLAAVGRAGTLAWILFACRSSFWSTLRAISDLPHALVTAVLAALLLLVVEAPRARKPSGVLPA